MIVIITLIDKLNYLLASLCDYFIFCFCFNNILFLHAFFLDGLCSIKRYLKPIKNCFADKGVDFS